MGFALSLLDCFLGAFASQPRRGLCIGTASTSRFIAVAPYALGRFFLGLLLLLKEGLVGRRRWTVYKMSAREMDTILCY